MFFDKIRQFGRSLAAGARQFKIAAFRAARRLQWPKLRRQSAKPEIVAPRRPLTPYEVKMMIAAAQLSGKMSLRDAALVQLLLTTGLRTIEIQRARWQDLERLPGRKGARLKVWGKGKEGRTQEVFVDAETVTMLEAAKGIRPGLFIFNGYKEQPLRTRSIRAAIDRLEQIAGLGGVSPHCFRHTMATIAVETGVPMEEVQKRLRHDNPANTRIYTKWAFRRLQSAFARKNRLLNFLMRLIGFREPA